MHHEWTFGSLLGFGMITSDMGIGGGGVNMVKKWKIVDEVSA